MGKVLGIPIYLNQQLIFDWIAVLEDGFSHLSSLKISSWEKEDKKIEGTGNIGTSNVFGFLNASFGAKRTKEEGSQEQKEISTEKVHTPNSLFSKLMSSLITDNRIKKIESLEDVKSVESGDFVLFSGILRKNPIVNVLESTAELLEISAAFQEQKKDQQGLMKISKQVKTMLESLHNSSTVEVIAEDITIPDLKYVLSTKVDYFYDNNINEVNDGQFFIFGKVIRFVASDEGEKINLLRKTSLGMLTPQFLEQMFSGFKDMETNGVKMPPVITEIAGPYVQIFPIAIYV